MATSRNRRSPGRGAAARPSAALRPELRWTASPNGTPSRIALLIRNARSRASASETA